MYLFCNAIDNSLPDCRENMLYHAKASGVLGAVLACEVRANCKPPHCRRASGVTPFLTIIPNDLVWAHVTH